MNIGSVLYIHDTEESCCRSKHFIESLRNVAEVRSFVDLHLTHYVEYLNNTTDVAKQVSYEILSYDNSFHNISNLIYFLKCILILTSYNRTVLYNIISQTALESS